MYAKSPLASKTIWGGILLIITPLLALLGIDLSSGEQETLTAALGGLTEAALTVVGLALVVYGRYQASRPLKPVGSVHSLMAGSLVFAALLLAGCAQGMSDRGSTGDTRAVVVVQKGVFFNAQGYAPSQSIDKQNFDVVASELDGQIQALAVALAAAQDAGDDGLAAQIATQIVALQHQRAGMQSGGAINYVDSGNITINTSGTATAASPGDTTQTPSVTTDAEGSLQLIP